MNKSDLKTNLFKVTYVLWIFYNCFFKYLNINNINNFIELFILMLFIVVISFNDYDLKDIIKSFLLFIICLITYKTTDNINYIILSLLIISTKEINIFDIAKTDIFIRSISLFFMIMFYFLGIINGNNICFTNEFLKCRYALGFSHPNNLFAQIFMLSVGIIIINIKKKKTKKLIFTFLLLIFFGIITGCKTGVILTIVLYIFLLLNLQKKINLQQKNYLFKYSYLNFMAISYIFAKQYKYKNRIIIFINDLVSNRVMFSSRFLEKYGITFFGQKVFFRNSFDAHKYKLKGMILDNMYMYNLICSGLIFSLMFYYLITRTLSNLLRKKEYFIVIIYFIYSIYSLMEKTLLSLDNYLLFFLSIGLFDNYKKS